jgi:hypothetical protein
MRVNLTLENAGVGGSLAGIGTGTGSVFGVSLGCDDGPANVSESFVVFASNFRRLLACQTSLAFSRAPASLFFVFWQLRL